MRARELAVLCLKCASAVALLEAAEGAKDARQLKAEAAAILEAAVSKPIIAALALPYPSSCFSR